MGFGKEGNSSASPPPPSHRPKVLEVITIENEVPNINTKS